MTVNEVKKQIKTGNLCPFYVFTGAEIEAQRIYINKIAEVTNKPVKRIESVKEAFNRRASILKVSNIFVCRDDKEFWGAATRLEDISNLLGDNILILQMTDIDGRSKASKKYTQRSCSLSDENTYELIDMCENDYSKILLETNKINIYARAQGVNKDEAFNVLVQDGTITRPPKDAIFKFVDAFLRADIQRAFELLQDCKEIGEPALRLISVLYSNVKRVLQVQVCESKDICKTTGLSAWDVKLARQTVGSWQSEDLVFFLKTFQAIEQGIKLGEIDEESAMDYLMVSVL